MYNRLKRIGRFYEHFRFLQYYNEIKRIQQIFNE